MSSGLCGAVCSRHSCVRRCCSRGSCVRNVATEALQLRRLQGVTASGCGCLLQSLSTPWPYCLFAGLKDRTPQHMTTLPDRQQHLQTSGN